MCNLWWLSEGRIFVCMQLFTGIHGKGAFLNGNPIKGKFSFFINRSGCYLGFASISRKVIWLFFDGSLINFMLCLFWDSSVSSQSELVKSLLCTEVCAWELF